MNQIVIDPNISRFEVGTVMNQFMISIFLVLRYYLAVGKLEKQLDEMRQVVWILAWRVKEWQCFGGRGDGAWDTG